MTPLASSPPFLFRAGSVVKVSFGSPGTLPGPLTKFGPKRGLGTWKLESIRSRITLHASRLKPPPGSPQATPRPPGSQPLGTPKPPQSYPQATLRLPIGSPEAPAMRSQRAKRDHGPRTTERGDHGAELRSFTVINPTEGTLEWDTNQRASLWERILGE
jgi:hypothetical protein